MARTCPGSPGSGQLTRLRLSLISPLIPHRLPTKIPRIPHRPRPLPPAVDGRLRVSTPPLRLRLPTAGLRPRLGLPQLTASAPPVRSSDNPLLPLITAPRRHLFITRPSLLATRAGPPLANPEPALFPTHPGPRTPVPQPFPLPCLPYRPGRLRQGRPRRHQVVDQHDQSLGQQSPAARHHGQRTGEVVHPLTGVEPRLVGHAPPLPQYGHHSRRHPRPPQFSRRREGDPPGRVMPPGPHGPPRGRHRDQQHPPPDRSLVARLAHLPHPGPHSSRQRRTERPREPQSAPLLVRQQHRPHRIRIPSRRMHDRQSGRLRHRSNPARCGPFQGGTALRTERRARPPAASALGRQHQIGEVLPPPPHAHHCANTGAGRPPLWKTPCGKPRHLSEQQFPHQMPTPYNELPPPLSAPAIRPPKDEHPESIRRHRIRPTTPTHNKSGRPHQGLPRQKQPLPTTRSRERAPSPWPGHRDPVTPDTPAPSRPHPPSATAPPPAAVRSRPPSTRPTAHRRPPTRRPP